MLLLVERNIQQYHIHVMAYVSGHAMMKIVCSQIDMKSKRDG